MNFETSIANIMLAAIANVDEAVELANKLRKND